MSNIVIALSRGRVLDAVLPLLERAGVALSDDWAQTRKLLLDTGEPKVKVLVARGADVSTFVSRGVAQLGVVGSDLLQEHEPQGVYQMLDLGVGRCRVATAGLIGSTPPTGAKRKVATKLPAIASRYYAGQGIQAEIIGLKGGIELSPLLGLSDEIVDIVDTGNTLKANGLEVRTVITEVSARLIVNKAATKTRMDIVGDIVNRVRGAVVSNQ